MPVASPSRLPWRTFALSTALALGAAVGTYQILSDDDAPDRTDDTLTLTTDDPAEPSEVSFTTFDGEAVSLDSLRGTPTVVNFFASTCIPCITEMPAFEEVHQALGDSVAFLGLAVADQPEDALDLVERTGVTYATAQDKDQSVFNAISGGLGLPTTVLLDADGEVAAQHTGALTANELAELITETFGTVA